MKINAFLFTLFASFAAGTAIAAPFRTNPGAFSDGIILATFAGLKIGPEEVRDFAKQKAFAERMKAQGVDVEICVSSTIGHMDNWQLVQDYPKMVGANGKTASAVACPRSDKFKDCMRGVFANAAESGVRMSREELKAAILSDATANGVRVRAAWRKYCSRALTELGVAIADAVHEVDDKIVIGFMCCNPTGLAYAPIDFKSLIERTRNRDGAVWFRHGSGTYTDFTPYSNDSIVAKNVAIARYCAATEGPGVVNLTEEVTSPYNRRTKSLRITFLEAALNVGLAGADGVTYDAIKPNLDEQLRDDALVADIHRRRGELDRMRALVEGKRQIGVYPFYDSDVWLANGQAKSLYDMGVLGAEDWKPLIYIGVPFTFREQDASLLLLSGKSARAVPKEKLAAWRGRGVIEDGAAAAEVGSDGKTFVFGKGAWSNAVWARKESLEIKDALDRLAGGRMPSRVDTCTRLAQSVWESQDKTERVVFLFNLDFDDATDVRLTEDGAFSAERMEKDGSWTPLGTGDAFAVPCIPAWTPAVIRMKRIPSCR